MMVVIIIMMLVQAGVCSQDQHSHNTSQGGWRHNPKTAGSAAAVTITKIIGTQKRYGYTFCLV
jgi:hypothetical protein